MTKRLSSGDLDLLAQYPDLLESALYPYRTAFFPKQRAFFNDAARYKLALCTRRAGKTVVLGLWLYDGGMQAPGGLSVYIARTSGNASLILLNTLRRMNAQYGLGMSERNIKGQLIVELPNRHQIWLSGVPHAGEIEKFRGVSGPLLAGITRAAIDEAQAIGPWIQPLVEDVLDAALLDQNGCLAMIGTPSAVPTGYFYSASTGDWEGKDSGLQWSVHRWSLLENVHLPDAAAKMAEKIRLYRWKPDNPTLRREYQGEWVRDLDSLVYPYDPALNAYVEIPTEGTWHCAIGFDIGFSNVSAYVVGRWRDGYPELYLTCCRTFAGKSPSELADILKAACKEHGATQVIVDHGGLGVGYIREFQLHSVPAVAAMKSEKRAHQEIFAGELRGGRILAHPADASELTAEWTKLQWKEGRKEEDERYANHCCDAALYLARGAGRVAIPIELPALEVPMSSEKRQLQNKLKRQSRSWWK